MNNCSCFFYKKKIYSLKQLQIYKIFCVPYAIRKKSALWGKSSHKGRS